jgi:hypothetical protein
MELAARGLSAFGFAFDPFEHLDSTIDPHLQEYLVIPKAVEIVLSDQPVAIFAQPGGGKSALRLYTANIYKDSRGVKFPVTYIPDTYSTQPDLHEEGIRRSLARAVFMYLVSYPDLFLVLSSRDRRTIKSILLDLPFGFDFNLSALKESRFLLHLEQALGVPAFSGIPKLDQAHQQLFLALTQTSPLSTSLTLDEFLDSISEAFGTKSIHILVDGLDGFVETRPSHALIEWIEPLLTVLNEWDKKNIYLKFFLPMDISDVPALAGLQALRAAALTWDNNLLAELVRRRVFVASGGNFDSLDAISAPDVRNVELTLARQLREAEKLPRQIILKSRKLLQTIIGSSKEWISSEDLFSAGEPEHVTFL